MRPFNYLFALLVFTLLWQSQGLAQRNCATMDVLEQQLQEDPGMLQRMNAIERFTERYIQQLPQTGESRNVITIPVVVHIVYNNATENISEAQVLSQMDVLNDDFRRLNADADNTWPQAADIEVEFCLATVDPNGNATNGITRTPTSVSAFGTNDAVKFTSQGGKDAWPAGDYLNMWVCDISGGILGYAQFPGGPANTDGVVMDYQYFGTIGTATAPFDLGRTTTHEVGHWLNLRHIWGDGPCSQDDFVSDTPTSDAPNYGCNTGHVSCSTTDMVQNYMDYSDDGCMNLFTSGQKNRMRALFNSGGFRASLPSSNGCGTPGGGGGSTCSGTESSFPSNDDFEGGLDGWTQATGDDLDWTRRSGGTPSSNTGPSGAASGTFYMYIEASSPNYPSKTAIFNSPCYDLSSLSNPEFDFQYHMLGNAVGTLRLEASTDGSSWTELWSRSGTQGGTWNSANVSLAAYAGEPELRLRFRGTTASSWQGDMCIDGLSLSDAGSGGGGGCADNEVTLTLITDNYPGETTWTITDDGGNIVASGGPYGSQGTTYTETFCLPDGCYDFNIFDSYGDGICCAWGNGSYDLTDDAGNSLAGGGSFGSGETTNFCLGSSGGGDPCPPIDFNSYTINSYGSGQDNGSFQIQDGGATLFIRNNAWKAIAYPYTITANTVIEFDFQSTIQGEIHGLAFDNDDNISSNLTFKVHGTQNWGITNYDNYPGSGWVTYTIPVGSFYTGTTDRLAFVADHDGGARNGNSYFRNVRVYEGSCSSARGSVPAFSGTVRQGSGLAMHLFPNPARDVLTLNLEVEQAGNGQLLLTDVAGKVLRVQDLNLDSGLSSFPIRVAELPAGVYFLRFSQGDVLETRRFVIAR